jgi:hypothetical protein
MLFQGLNIAIVDMVASGRSNMRMLSLGLLGILLACSSSEKGKEVPKDILEQGQDVVLTDTQDTVEGEGLLEENETIAENIGDDSVTREDGIEVAEDKGTQVDEGVSFLDKGGGDREDIQGDVQPEIPTSPHYKGRVWSISPGGQDIFVPGAVVRALDPSTGWALPGYQATSDSEGYVEFDFDWAGTVGFKVSKENYVDSYQFDQRTDSLEGELLILPSDLINQVMSDLGVELTQGKGMLTGNVEWRSSNGGGQVGCATITTTPGCDIFYFDKIGMPQRPETQNMTSSQNGGFIALNCEPAKTHIQAKIEDTVVGEGDAFVYGDGITTRFTITIPSEFDPTPANCPY